MDISNVKEVLCGETVESMVYAELLGGYFHRNACSYPGRSLRNAFFFAVIEHKDV